MAPSSPTGIATRNTRAAARTCAGLCPAPARGQRPLDPAINRRSFLPEVSACFCLQHAFFNTQSKHAPKQKALFPPLSKKSLPSLPMTRSRVQGNHSPAEGVRGARSPSGKNFPQESSWMPKRRSLRAFRTTETEEQAIAAPANMGDIPGPPSSLSSPAARGMHKIL